MSSNYSCQASSHSIIACQFPPTCCFSQISNSGNLDSDDPSNPPIVNVTVTYWQQKSDCDSHKVKLGGCPSNLYADSQPPDYFQGCCKNKTRYCIDCQPGASSHPFLMSWEPETEILSATISPPTPTAPTMRFTPSSATNPADQFGGANLGSSASSFAPPTSSTEQFSASPTSGLGSSSKGPPVVSQPTKSSNTATVAGGVTGGLVALALLLAVLVHYRRWRATGPLQTTNQTKFSIRGSGRARPIDAGAAELQEIKQGPSPTSSLLHPPSSWPLPPPPGYTPYRSQGTELDRSPPNVSQPSASSPQTFDIHPHTESPPSPPPLNTRCSQDSADNNSEAPSVSPISSHYQRHPLDESEDLKASVYSEISSKDLFHTHIKRS